MEPKPQRRELSQNFWALVWRRFKKNKGALFAFYLLCFLGLVALFHPFIVGTKPVMCRYKGELYFPVMWYYSGDGRWENNVFDRDKFRGEYPSNLLKKDPESWAIWPLVYQDPYRKVREREWDLISKEWKRRDEVEKVRTELEGRKSGSLAVGREIPAPQAPVKAELTAEADGIERKSAEAGYKLATDEYNLALEEHKLDSELAALAMPELETRLADLEAQKPNWKHEPSARFHNRMPGDNNSPPTAFNILGTDEYGRDIFARLVHGTPIALLVGFVSMGIATSIGLLVGGTAGLLGGWADTLLTRFMDVVLSIPSLILILALIAIIPKPTIWHMMAIIGATSWVGIARLVRGEFLKLRNMEFTVAARAIGASQLRIMFRHLMPNALAPVLVSVSFGIAGAILVESGLSFLGFGVQPPTPSWGSVLRDGFRDLTQWWLVLFSGGFIFITVFTYNMVGDGLQEAMDPRLKR